jgi:hypothetical protein
MSWAFWLSGTAIVLSGAAVTIGGMVLLDVGTVATILGDGLAAAAVVMAAFELRRAKRAEAQARREVAEERRRTFEIAQLVALADVIGDFGTHADWHEAIRIRLLPATALPVTRRWVDDYDGLFTWFCAEVLPQHPEGYAFGSWVRQTAQTEIRQALDVLVGASDVEERDYRDAVRSNPSGMFWAAITPS